MDDDRWQRTFPSSSLSESLLLKKVTENPLDLRWTLAIKMLLIIFNQASGILWVRKLLEFAYAYDIPTILNSTEPEFDYSSYNTPSKLLLSNWIQRLELIIWKMEHSPPGLFDSLGFTWNWNSGMIIIQWVRCPAFMARSGMDAPRTMTSPNLDGWQQYP